MGSVNQCFRRARPRRCATLCAGSAWLVLLVASSRTAAHPEFTPLETNRYLKVTLVDANRVRLAYTLMHGNRPALAVRRAMDGNHDGHVSPEEARQTASAEAPRLAAGLHLELDGRPVHLSFGEPEVGLVGDAVAPDPLSIDLVAFVALAPAPEHRLRIESAEARAATGETEVRVEEGPGTRLLESWRGADRAPAARPQTVFLFRGPPRTSLEDRSISIRWATPLAPRTAAGWWIALGALVALGTVSILVLKRRARPRA